MTNAGLCRRIGGIPAAGLPSALYIRGLSAGKPGRRRRIRSFTGFFNDRAEGNTAAKAEKMMILTAGTA
jgi:hypothetical protein